MRSSLKTITILTELPLKLIFHTVEVNHDYILDVLVLYMLPEKSVIVLYTYITKSGTFCRCVQDV